VSTTKPGALASSDASSARACSCWPPRSSASARRIDLRKDHENRLRFEQRARDQGSRHRGGSDRDQRRQRIAADNQLERIEGTGERGVERGRDGRCGTAPDKDPQIVAAQLEQPAERRGGARTQLRKGGFETDRGADPGRQHGQQRQPQTVDQRHAPAMQRVGLDRIDDVARAPPPERRGDQPVDQSAERRHQQQSPRRDCLRAA
jgi:hypothetical protein